jgi:hypothetical protein
LVLPQVLPRPEKTAQIAQRNTNVVQREQIEAHLPGTARLGLQATNNPSHVNNPKTITKNNKK